MSTIVTVRKLVAAASLESLKKEAKRWLKAVREGDPDARQRLQRVVPDSSNNIGLREMQHALALEHGTSSWAALKDLLADRQLASRSAAERADDFLRHAIDRQNGDIAAQILREHPDVAHFSIHTAAVSGDLVEVQRRLALDSTAAASVGGPKSWQPLQYLCYARMPVEHTSANAVPIARVLLAAGADANATFKDDWNNPFTLITGVIGEGEQQNFVHPQSQELVRLLLGSGADPYDTQSLYNTSLHHDDTTWLEILYSNSGAVGKSQSWLKPKYGPHPDNGMVDYLLGNAVSRNHLRRATWLLDRGARATTVHSYSKYKLHTEALLHGFVEMAALLERHGAKPELLDDSQAFQAACMRMDGDAAKRLLQKHPHFLHDPKPLFLAADFDLVHVAAFLLDLGMSPNVGEGAWSALHSAAYNGSMRVARLLVERGAKIDVRERKYNSTPLGHALYSRKQAMVEYLGGISGDVFALVQTGNLERLRAVLDADPSLATGTLNGKSLLFFLSGSEERVLDIAELLLARGADPTIKNAEGVTAGDIAAKYGVDELAELLREAATQHRGQSK